MKGLTTPTMSKDSGDNLFAEISDRITKNGDISIAEVRNMLQLIVPGSDFLGIESFQDSMSDIPELYLILGYGWDISLLNDITLMESHNRKYIFFPRPIRLKQIPLTDPPIQDSGERISYGEGKAEREPSTGKGRYDLITPFGLARLARWYELGAQKYSDRNWEKGIPYSRYMDSAFRHMTRFMMGMEDEDHLAAACWNLLAIMHHQAFEENESLDDLPHYWSGRKKETLNGLY